MHLTIIIYYIHVMTIKSITGITDSYFRIENNEYSVRMIVFSLLNSQ